MDEFENIFTFRNSGYNPPCDCLFGEDDDIGEFDIDPDKDNELTLAIFGLNHIVWN